MALMDSLSIRQAVIGDADNIALLEAEEFLDEALNCDNVKKAIEDSQVCIYIAELDGEFAGYSIIHFAADEGELSTIAVKKEYRGRKIGQFLLEKAICGDNLIKNLFLEVRESNLSAQKLYRRMGFVEVGRRKSFYKNPMEDALLMALQVE